MGYGLRRLPTQVPHRRSRERNAPEYINTRLIGTFQYAVPGPDLGSVLCEDRSATTQDQ